MTQEEGAPAPSEASVRYLKYSFFKVSKDFRSLDAEQKALMKGDFVRALDGSSAKTGIQCFSLVGFRGDVDFLVISEAEDIEVFQDLLSKVMRTGLGRYLDTPYSYLAVTRRSRYLGEHKHPGQEGGGNREGGLSKYIFVYPFVKKREWYRLPFAERQRIMADHFRVGHKYPRVKINTGYSFGLDDQEFVLSFEGDDPAEFLSLVEELRSSESSMYTQLETPIFTCRRVEATAMLDLVG